MKNLSYMQEYYICVVTKNGNLPVLNGLIATVCFVVGGVMELASQGCIVRDEKGLFSVIKPFDDSLPYLKPIYNTIARLKKPADIESIVYDCCSYVIEGVNAPNVFTPLGESLVTAGCVIEIPSLFRKKPKYAPQPEAVKCLIEKIRNTFQEASSIPSQTLCLAVLLDKSGDLRNYFEKDELSVIKCRIDKARTSETDESFKEILDYTDAIPIIASRFLC